LTGSCAGFKDVTSRNGGCCVFVSVFDFFEDFEKLFFSSETPHLKAGDDDQDEHDLQVDRLTIFSDFIKKWILNITCYKNLKKKMLSIFHTFISLMRCFQKYFFALEFKVVSENSILKKKRK